MLDLFQAPIRVHLRPFAVKNRLPGPPEPPERPKWTANERKFTQMGRPDPVLGHFHAFRGHPPVLSPPRTAYGYPTSAPPPPAPLRVIFDRKMPHARPLLRDWHYVAPQNLHKASFARFLGQPPRALFPEPAARCALDPAPAYAYYYIREVKHTRFGTPYLK